MSSSGKVVFIVGPTAVGKTAFAFQLAQKLNSEIISCDAMQVYRQISILNNKPSPSILNKILHHLIGIISISQEFNVMDFNKRALSIISEIHSRNKIPVICGGSGMYMAILLDGIFEGAPQNSEIRRQLEQLAKEKGEGALFQKLEELDPQAAAKIHPNDKVRLIRALEVISITGKPISKIKENRSGIFGLYDVKVFGLQMLRENLYKKINERVEEMFAAGAVKEIEKLKDHQWSLTAGKIIGVNEIKQYLAGEHSLDRAKYLIKMNTRHYAKRQLTWFRKEKRIQWIDLEEYSIEKAAQKILNDIKE